jgi:hypothetical protein
MKKKSCFSDINEIYTTYSSDEYLCHQIDSILYKKKIIIEYQMMNGMLYF